MMDEDEAKSLELWANDLDIDTIAYMTRKNRYYVKSIILRVKEEEDE